MATIDGFRHNLVGANNHSMVFDGCVSCQRSGAKSCERCRKSLQLRGKPFTILRPDAVTAVRSSPLSSTHASDHEGQSQMNRWLFAVVRA